MPVRRPALLALIATAALAGLAGCGSKDKGGDTTVVGSQGQTTAATTSTAPATTTTTTSTATTPTGIDTMPGAGTAPVTVPATNTRTALLTNVRAARHEGYDRVVFEFRDAVPGYDVRYVTPPVRQDGSGRAVAVKGSAILRIRMENALDADLSTDSATLTYTGPRRFSPGTPEIVELAQVGGFENVLTWAAGLQDKVDFRVRTLTSPPRVVLDVRNH